MQLPWFSLMIDWDINTGMVSTGRLINLNKPPNTVKQFYKNILILLLIGILLFSLFTSWWRGKVQNSLIEFIFGYWRFYSLQWWFFNYHHSKTCVWLFIKKGKIKNWGLNFTSRMVSNIHLLSLPPVLIVYIFSTQFLNSYIDSWFDTKTDKVNLMIPKLGQIFRSSNETSTGTNKEHSTKTGRNWWAQTGNLPRQISWGINHL